LPDERWGEAVSAAVVLAPGRDVDADAVRAFARTQLAGFKKPVHVFFLTELPRNSGLKVMKHVLKERLAERVSPSTEGVTA
jgi:acyl-CoA synthetase (AMP-forming)/AMP-acid ligase II